MPKSKKTIGLESNLENLETIVEQLESGEINLDESLKLFEKGVDIYKTCKKSLGDIEKKIKVLTDNLKEEDFEE